MKIPDEAVEAAYDVSGHLYITTSEIEHILEAAAPYLLAHELEQTRLAHLDAVVNAQGLAAAWEAGVRHALAWLGLKQYGDVMALDNPHKGDA